MSISIAPMTDAAAAHAIIHAGYAHDRPGVPPPDLAEFLAGVRHPRSSMVVEHHVARLDGEPAGYLAIEIPQADNLATVTLQLVVRPELRRRGVGRALFAVAVARAGELGRPHVSGMTAGPGLDGAAFAAAMGASEALTATRHRLELPPPDPDRLRALLADAWAHAGGYRLIQGTGVPADEIIDEVARLESGFFGAAPIGDLAWEPQRVDAARIRRDVAAQTARGRVLHHTGALLGDRLAAWTVLVGTAARPSHARQGITLVEPAHRGRRLGLLVKLANLAYAGELQPGLRVVDTVNADGNTHVLRINRLIGFRAAAPVSHWQWTG